MGYLTNDNSRGEGVHNGPDPLKVVRPPKAHLNNCFVVIVVSPNIYDINIIKYQPISCIYCVLNRVSITFNDLIKPVLTPQSMALFLHIKLIRLSIS